LLKLEVPHTTVASIAKSIPGVPFIPSNGCRLVALVIMVFALAAILNAAHKTNAAIFVRKDVLLILFI
jgi:hypothetical protein